MLQVSNFNSKVKEAKSQFLTKKLQLKEHPPPPPPQKKRGRGVEGDKLLFTCINSESTQIKETIKRKIRKRDEKRSQLLTVYWKFLDIETTHSISLIGF